MRQTDATAPTGTPAVRPGTRVEVHSAFSGRWVQGFEVVECASDGYRLRRCSDHALLPAVFSPAEVRTSA